MIESGVIFDRISRARNNWMQVHRESKGLPRRLYLGQNEYEAFIRDLVVGLDTKKYHGMEVIIVVKEDYLEVS